LGSPLFPIDRVEEHSIQYIAAADDQNLGDYSMIERVRLGGVRRNKKKLAKVDLDEVSANRFRQVWDCVSQDLLAIKTVSYLA